MFLCFIGEALLIILISRRNRLDKVKLPKRRFSCFSSFSSETTWKKKRTLLTVLVVVNLLCTPPASGMHSGRLDHVVVVAPRRPGGQVVVEIHFWARVRARGMKCRGHSRTWPHGQPHLATIPACPASSACIVGHAMQCNLGSWHVA